MSDTLWAFPSVYRGQVSPNFWHNPTGIFTTPFALAAFFAGLRRLEKPGIRLAALTLRNALVLSLLAKPNYALAFAPCLACALVTVLFLDVWAGRRKLGKLSKSSRLSLRYQRSWSGNNAHAGRRQQLRVDWFRVWKSQSPNIPASIFLGIAFPLAATLLFIKSSWRSLPLVLAWATLIVAVTQFAMLIEYSPTHRDRMGHGNCGWAMLFADAVLFVVATDFVLRQPSGWLQPRLHSVDAPCVATGLVCLADRCLLVPEFASMF